MASVCTASPPSVKRRIWQCLNRHGDSLYNTYSVSCYLSETCCWLGRDDIFNRGEKKKKKKKKIRDSLLEPLTLRLRENITFRQYSQPAATWRRRIAQLHKLFIVIVGSRHTRRHAHAYNWLINLIKYDSTFSSSSFLWQLGQIRTS